MAAPMDTCIASKEIKFNFPQLSVQKRGREIFSACGSGGHITGDSYETLLQQRDQTEPLYQSGPVLPVYFKHGTFTEKDSVCLNSVMVNKQMRAFIDDISEMRIKNQNKKYRQTTQKLINSITDKTHSYVDAKVPTWCQSGFERYKQVKHYSGREINNYKYTNGCMVCIPSNKRSGFMITPTTANFKALQLSHISTNKDDIVHVDSVSTKDFTSSIHGISHRQVCDTDVVCVKTDKKCYIYSLNTDTQPYTLVRQNTIRVPEPSHNFQNISISPYIPNEYSLTTDEQEVFLWSGGQLEKLFTDTVSGSEWCNVYFGSHPRSLVYTTQCSVRLYDLRCSPYSPVDLLSEQFLCKDGHEKFRVCQNSPWSPFYHFVATDYSFLLLDERFPKLPVMRTEHMLQTMPQYISPLSTAGYHLVYVGNQCQSTVHRMVFSESRDHPPQVVGLPRRISPWSDLNLVPDLTHGCDSTDIVRTALSGYLAGIQAMPLDEHSHMLLQLDGHGEIFYQTFHSHSNHGYTPPSDIHTQSSTSVHWNPAAVEQANLWMTKIGNQIGKPKSQTKKGNHLQLQVEQNMKKLETLPTSTAKCPLCCPGSVRPKTLSKEKCQACKYNPAAGWMFRRVAQMDKLFPCKKTVQPFSNREESKSNPSKKVKTDNG